MKFNNYICLFVFLVFSAHVFSESKPSLKILAGSKNSASFRQQITKKGEDYYIHFSIDSIFIENDSIIPNSCRLIINGLFENHNDGEPALLFKRDFYKVPNNSKICVTMLDSNYVDIPLTLSPARPFYKQNDNDTSCLSVQPISSYHGFFPQNTVSFVGEEHYRGSKIISLCLIPVKYNLQEQKIRVYKEAKYKISFIQQKVSASESESECKRIVPTDKFVQNFVQNNTSSEHRAHVEDCTQDYLILTTPTYESSAHVFAEWKRTLGFNTKTIIKNSWTSDQIRNYVQEEHNFYNCLGDPSMLLHTEKPTEFDFAIVTREADKITVQPYEEAIVSFYNRNTFEVQSFYTDGEVVNYPCNPTNFIVSIHYHNKIPYIQLPLEELYLQNQNIQGNQFFNAKKVYIGSNVTNGSPNGPVTFSNGNIKISANDVEINGETTIQVGTSLEITTGN